MAARISPSWRSPTARSRRCSASPADGHPGKAQRLFVEARATNLIDHPSLVQVWDAGQLEDGTAYLVMEYLTGESLGARLRRLGKLPLDATLQIAWQIADALTAVHARGILHRRHALDAAVLGTGSVWLVGGESGVGKSRLLDELRTLALVRGKSGARPGD